jgi:hypothetical protein
MLRATFLWWLLFVVILMILHLRDVALHSFLVLHFLLARQKKTKQKKNAFWAYRSAGPEASSTLLGRARLGGMALDFRPLHSIYWAVNVVSSLFLH